jgi:hypothetical protein
MKLDRGEEGGCRGLGGRAVSGQNDLGVVHCGCDAFREPDYDQDTRQKHRGCSMNATDSAWLTALIFVTIVTVVGVYLAYRNRGD